MLMRLVHDGTLIHRRGRKPLSSLWNMLDAISSDIAGVAAVIFLLNQNF
jgi:hypothetical protein